MAVSFIGGGNPSIWRIPLTNCIIQCCIEYTSRCVEFQTHNFQLPCDHDYDGPIYLVNGFQLEIFNMFHSRVFYVNYIYRIIVTLLLSVSFLPEVRQLYKYPQTRIARTQIKMIRNTNEKIKQLYEVHLCYTSLIRIRL